MEKNFGSHKFIVDLFVMKNSLLFLGTIFLLSLFACKKDSFITSGDARLNISTDSLRFDTVFTSVGSVTQSFKIRNDNEQPLQLSEIKLMGGNSSSFRLNINGVATNQLSNIAIAAEDSIYVFVSVTVNPTAANLPFIISDSISIQYNGNQRWVQLEAYGQNANFINGLSITSNTSFTNTKPYVILDYLHVEEGVTLTIPPGTKIYAHANAPIIVDGSINAIGDAFNKITFSGNRLDAPYNDFPASWPGIIFRSSSIDNIFQFVEIKNAYQAMVVDQPATNSNPKLLLLQCSISNAYDAGILAINSSINASNVLISNCANNIAVQGGGNYSFTHCTAASFSNNYLLHKTPVLTVLNFVTQNAAVVTNELNANFSNCIFWGDAGFIENELVVGKQGALPFTVSFTNCLYRSQVDPPNAVLTNVIKNQEPLFDSIDASNKYYDFRFTKNPSPALEAAAASAINKDLDNNGRPVGLPDIGCYEKQ
ncbi:MAG TPA: hypothetical protein PK504_07095 [Ferruginibacter sp.]|nr:hypothetical protein [Ferruginibacter sp.]HRE62253.1 hypothetical protein [Ferruginibacter sp.]